MKPYNDAVRNPGIKCLVPILCQFHVSGEAWHRFFWGLGRYGKKGRNKRKRGYTAGVEGWLLGKEKVLTLLSDIASIPEVPASTDPCIFKPKK